MPGNDDRPVVVTGSSGFVGNHLCAELGRTGKPFVGVDRVRPPADASYQSVTLDLRDMDALRSASALATGRPVIHLAAEAEVVTPWDQIPATFLTNLNATWNTLTALEPKLMVFASSSAVYGNALRNQSPPRLSSARPLGVYGASKSMGEILLRDWAKDTGAVAVVFRLGNVIGAGCRGLIPYLVRHAQRYPEAEVVAELRGKGKLLRDYTPVEYVVRAFRLALEHKWTPGTSPIFNVGTGRGIDNEQVVGMVAKILKRKGYRLRCNFANPVPASEAMRVVLNCESLERRFGLEPPSPERVEASIEESVESYLAG